jgi:hypothetical protein
VEFVTRSYILAFMPLLPVTYIQGWLQACCSVTRCPELLPCIMNILYASRISPDRKMESTVERKLSMGTFLWFMAEFSVICEESCIGNMTHNVYVKGS